MFKSRFPLAILALIAAMLACNLPAAQSNQPDPGAILTAAALTVQAQIPATTAPVEASATLPLPSATASYTPLPLPTAVPATPTSNCDNGHFVTDVTIPDGTNVTAGDTFTKTWRLKNTGTCSWTPSYAVVFVSGDAMSGPAVQALSGNVNPGQTVDVSVSLTAPTGNGSYTGNWGLRNASGVIFARFYVQIDVGGSGAGPFAVIHVNFSVTGSCPNFNVSVDITTNAAGTVTYHFVSSDSSSTSPTNLVFGSATTKTVTFARYFGVAHSSLWTDIYIDAPNHQQFGRATFTCP